LEAGGLLRTLGVQVDGAGVVNQERPADVLLCRAQDIRVGQPQGGSAGKVALDVGIVCSQAASHLASAAAERLGAAEEYVRTKCTRADMENRCRQAGVVFQPMVFESLGGVSGEAVKVIKSLNQVVAAATDSPHGEVATRFWQRISIDIQRFGHRALVRRVTRLQDFSGDGAIRYGGHRNLEIPGGL